MVCPWFPSNVSCCFVPLQSCTTEGGPNVLLCFSSSVLRLMHGGPSSLISSGRMTSENEETSCSLRELGSHILLV